MVTVESLEKELKQNNLNCLYLLYGEELFILETCLKKIKTNFGELKEGINYIKIDEKNLHELIPNIETPSFGYDKKLIIVRDSGFFKKQDKKKTNNIEKEAVNKIVEYLKNNIEYIKELVVLVFVEQEVEKNDLYKVIDEFRYSL